MLAFEDATDLASGDGTNVRIWLRMGANLEEKVPATGAWSIADIFFWFVSFARQDGSQVRSQDPLTFNGAMTAWLSGVLHGAAGAPVRLGHYLGHD